MAETVFRTVSGAASSKDGTSILPSMNVDRMVMLVLDDSNWILECATSRRPARGARAKIPFGGPMPPFKLFAKQDLFVFATAATGSSSTTWDLSIIWWPDAA